MSSMNDFRASHPDEIGADGVVRVCIGGGAGFIGSHIAKKLMADVSAFFSKYMNADIFFHDKTLFKYDCHICIPFLLL